MGKKYWQYFYIYFKIFTTMWLLQHLWSYWLIRGSSWIWLCKSEVTILAVHLQYYIAQNDCFFKRSIKFACGCCCIIWMERKLNSHNIKTTFNCIGWSFATRTHFFRTRRGDLRRCLVVPGKGILTMDSICLVESWVGPLFHPWLQHIPWILGWVWIWAGWRLAQSLRALCHVQKAGPEWYLCSSRSHCPVFGSGVSLFCSNI